MEQVPGPRTVMVPASMAQGPSEVRVTGWPEVDCGVTSTQLFWVRVPTLPGFQAGDPVGVTVMVSGVGAG